MDFAACCLASIFKSDTLEMEFRIASGTLQVGKSSLCGSTFLIC
jgi:hypothetical protein